MKYARLSTPVFLLLIIASVGYTDPPVEEWVALYDGSGNDDDYAYDITLEDGKYIYVTGCSYSGAVSGYDFTTIKYDYDGNEIWVSNYDGPASSWDEATSIAVDDSGNVYIAGWSQGVTSSSDYATIKYNSDGTQLWVARYDGPDSENDSAIDIGLFEIDFVYVTGYSEDTSLYEDYTTVRYNSDGSEEWVINYNGQADDHDRPVALAVDSDANVIVTGNSYVQSSNMDYATVKYSKNGSELWCATYDGPSGMNEYACDIIAYATDYICVTGTSESDVNLMNYLTVQYSSEGSEVWASSYDGPGNDDDYAAGITSDNSGNVYVTGQSTGIDTGSDFATVKYDYEGVEQWVARYDSPSSKSDEAYAVAVDDLGNVYVTGFAEDSLDNYDYATIMYDSDGNEQWVMNYDGPLSDYDEAHAIAVDSKGNVFVTGFSYGMGNNYDFATVMYSQDLGIGHTEGTGDLELFPVSPNPCSGTFALRYFIPESSTANLGVYDICGRLVHKTTMINQGTGIYQVNLCDELSGLYFCRLETETYSVTESFVIVR